MDSIDKASLLMGTGLQKKQGAAHSANVTTITGVAASDSIDGVVRVDLGGTTISDEDTQAVELPTTCDVREGDTVQIQVAGADGTAKSLLVTGVIAGGDRTRAEIAALILSVAEEYGTSTDPATPPTSWQATAPMWQDGVYIWTHSVITRGDGSIETTEPICTNAGKGKSGDPGVGIQTIDVQYYLSASPTTPTGGIWSTTAPTWEDGRYMWSKTITTLTDGSATESDPVCITGAQGKIGPQGPKGATGAAGTSSYTHIAYATSADGRTGFSVSDGAGKTYIGIYVDTVAQDSTDPTKYQWTLIKGADGAQGAPGKAGADGRTPYIHFAYANSADGTSGFSVSESVGKLYIGQYTDFTEADSTSPSKYSWSMRQEALSSLGEQLIINGSAIMGDNTNFPSMTFFKEEGRIGFKTDVKSHYVSTSAIIPIEKGQEYILSYDIKKTASDGTHWSGFYNLDIDGLAIDTKMIRGRSGTLTTLTQNLKPGDTTIHVASVSNWVPVSTNWDRGFIAWNYVDSTGYKWPAEVYSRNIYDLLWPINDASVFDYSNNTIKMTSPWNGPTILAGTKISQTYDGGEIQYLGADNLTLPTNEWTRLKYLINTDDLWAPTVYVKLGMIFNYRRTASSGPTYISNISLQNSSNAIKTLVRETDQGIEVGKVDNNGEYVGAHVLIDANGFDIIAQDGSNLGTFSADGLSTNIRASTITGSKIVSKSTNGSETKIENAQIVNKSTTISQSAADGHNIKGSVKLDNACYKVFGDPDETEADYPATYNPNPQLLDADKDLVTYVGSNAIDGSGLIKVYDRKTLGGKALGELGGEWLDSDATKKTVCGTLGLYSAETGKKIHNIGCTTSGNPGYFIHDKDGTNKITMCIAKDDNGHNNGSIYLNRADGSRLLYIGANSAGDLGLIWGYHKDGTAYMITPIVQQGTITVNVKAGSGYSTTINFVKPLPNADYHVSVTLFNTFAYWTDVRLAVESRTKTGFILRVYNTSTQYLSGINIGYSAIAI